MHRFLYLARRHPHLDAASFMQRWQAHESLAAGCPDVLAEVRGYRQWQVVGAAGRQDLPGDVMGVAETRCEDAAAVYRMLECPGTREVLQPDELRFLAVPCRQSGLVADDLPLHAAGRPGDHACLWLASRAIPGTTVATCLAVLQARFLDTVGETPAQLSAGWRDVGDGESPFAALLFARVATASLAQCLAEAWREALPPGENVWRLQRSLPQGEKSR